MRKVEVEWYDTQTFSDWYEDHEIDSRLKQSIVVKSIGYVYEKTKTYIAIVQSDALETKDGLLQIPCRAIKKVKTIK